MKEQDDVRNNEAEAGSDTWSRRSLLSWLGKGCVLSLTAPGVSGCIGSIFDGQEDRWTGCSESGFAFSPGRCDHGGWGERTVDRQHLENILKSWQLTIGGLVEEELTLSFDELVALPSHDPVVDFHCVEGWSVYDVPWNGVHLSELFSRVGVKPTATHVNFHTVGGLYNGSLLLPVALEENTLLAYGVRGSSLSVKHGFPVRMVIPRLFGYKSSKYVERIELSDHYVEGYWVKRGYSYSAEVPPSRLRQGKY